MTWVRDVARMRKIINAIRSSVAGLKGRDLLQDLGVDGRIIITWILKISDGGMGWIGLS
jgi:hypothetical protein